MTFQLISFDLWPYVQRSVITLLEKGAAHEITYIDLADKPQWFLDLSPTGKVPVLRVGEDRLFESAVINEYLDEVTGAPRLLPQEPLEKAQARMWIEYIGALGGPVYRMMVDADEAATRKDAATLNGMLGRLENELVGPLWAGEEFSLVDSAAAPFLMRIAWMEALVPDLGITRGLPKVARWMEALLSRPAVRGSVKPGIHATFVEYLQGAGSPTRSAPTSWLGTQA
jgi:glutathione S-transferase